MATENKEELIKKIAVLEAENLRLRQHSEELDVVKHQLKGVQKSLEENAANEHTLHQREEKLRVEIDGHKKTVELKDKQIEAMKADLTKLANLFDEYIVAYQDQNKMLNVFLKNSQTVEKYLSTKIDDFNGGNKK
jgi:hypothetical protein